MAWDHNIYYSPQGFGLEPVGELDWDDEAYQFNLTVLWWRPADEHFLMSDDSGCSCPTPFENHTLEELERVVSLTALKNNLRARAARIVQYSPHREVPLREDIERLLSAARERGMPL